MNDFDYENLQKKRVAQGARHRVCGAKSRKCSLPSDGLTEAQRRKLSGPVTRYELSKAVDWATFKSWPQDVQAEYLDRLREKFGVCPGHLSDLFGLTGNGVRTYLVKRGLLSRLNTRVRLTREQSAAWLAFCRKDGDTPARAEERNDAALLPAMRLMRSMTLSGAAEELLPVLASLPGARSARLFATLFFEKEEAHCHDDLTQRTDPLPGGAARPDSGK